MYKNARSKPTMRFTASVAGIIDDGPSDAQRLAKIDYDWKIELERQMQRARSRMMQPPKGLVFARKGRRSSRVRGRPSLGGRG
jgi:hypothetical protein